MSMAISCPQCRAALKLPETLAADSIVACPNCNLKFVPSPVASTSAPARASGGTAIVVALMILVVGAGVGVLIWNAMRQGEADPSNAQASTKPPSASTEPAKDGPPTKTPPVEPGASVKPAPKETPPTPPTTKDDELPDQPPPMTKKAPQKSYAETKRPQIDEVPTPTPIVNVKPAAAPAGDHPRQKEINEAIDKGVAYLKSTQLENGAWPKKADFLQLNYDVGYTSLAGLTLLECQVPADDPVVRKAAAFVRSTRIDSGHRTYEMACAILFLDRLGDPKDKVLIQSYALQLVAGQNTRAGWGYNCPELTGGELHQLLTFLEATRPAVADVRAGKNADGKLDDPLKGAAENGGNAEPPEAGQVKPMDPAQQGAKKAPAKPRPAVPPYGSLSRNVALIPVVYQHYHPKGVPPPPPMLPGGALNLMMNTDDNSNSQFAMLGLWTARRHGVPSELCLIAASKRYRMSQHGTDGGWGYQSSLGAPGSGQVGPGAPPIAAVQLMSHSTPAMTCVGLLGLAMGHGVSAKQAAKLADDPSIARGLRKLGEHIGPSEMGNFYFMWSVERVGVLYQLKTIGHTDWYDVGVAMLLPRGTAAQQADGSWSTPGTYQGSTTTLDTCFALLFLKRSNLVQDLTERLPFLMAITEPGARPNR
jgi:hypothetical protein